MSKQASLCAARRALKDERQKLQAEMDKVTKVATVVGGRLAKLVMDARRNASGNTQLVEELKRYNRRLEVRAVGSELCCQHVQPAHLHTWPCDSAWTRLQLQQVNRSQVLSLAPLRLVCRRVTTICLERQSASHIVAVSAQIRVCKRIGTCLALDIGLIAMLGCRSRTTASTTSSSPCRRLGLGWRWIGG